MVWGIVVWLSGIALGVIATNAIWEIKLLVLEKKYK